MNGHPSNSQPSNPAQLNGHIKYPVKSDGYLSHLPSLSMTQRDNSKTDSGSGCFYEVRFFFSSEPLDDNAVCLINYPCKDKAPMDISTYTFASACHTIVYYCRNCNGRSPYQLLDR